MGDSSPSAALILLGEVYREGRTGILTLGAEDEDERLGLIIRDGHVVGVVTPPDTPPEAMPRPARPDDSAQARLERVLAEVGLRPPSSEAESVAETSRPDDLRERLLAVLTESAGVATFAQTEDLPENVASVAGATEPLLLEAIRRLREPEAVRLLLGDLDRRLVITGALATEERTLTLTEGYILSRIDGQCTVREVLQVVPLDPDETERSLLGLILTGRVTTEAPPVKPARRPRTTPPAEEAAPPAAAAPEGDSEHIRLDSPLADELRAGERADHAAETAGAGAEGGAPEEMDAEALARRRQILEVFQSLPLLNHFEVLGLEPGCSDDDVRRAHRAHVKRYHPDMQRDPRLADLHDVLEAIFIRVGEAWEVLGPAKSRAAYEARLGPRVRKAGSATAGPPASAEEPEPDAAATLSPEETLMRAQRLLRSAQYWEAIRLLETAMPRLQPRRHEHRGRILLAKAYARNPNWRRKAEETLHNVVREDPANADAHYELGMLYKAQGLTARAHAMFKRAVELRPDHHGAAAEMGGAPPPPSGGLLSRLFRRGGGS